MGGVVNRPSSSVRSSSLPAHTEAPRRGAPVSASRTRPLTGRSTGGGAGAVGEEDAAASWRWRKAEGESTIQPVMTRATKDPTRTPKRIGRCFFSLLSGARFILIPKLRGACEKPKFFFRCYTVGHDYTPLFPLCRGNSPCIHRPRNDSPCSRVGP